MKLHPFIRCLSAADSLPYADHNDTPNRHEVRNTPHLVMMLVSPRRHADHGEKYILKNSVNSVSLW